jgi:hypothetical protein
LCYGTTRTNMVGTALICVCLRMLITQLYFSVQEIGTTTSFTLCHTYITLSQHDWDTMP